MRHVSAACEAHWARIRASLPPFVFKPHPPILRIQVTVQEMADVEKFKKLRRNARAEFEEAQRAYERAISERSA